MSDRTSAARLGMPASRYSALRADGYRWCWRCGAWHPLENFGRDAERSDGRRQVCKAACATAERARRERLRR